MTAPDVDICDIMDNAAMLGSRDIARAAAELRQTRKERDEADLSAGVLENAIDILMKRRDDELYKAHANGRAEFSRELADVRPAPDGVTKFVAPDYVAALADRARRCDTAESDLAAAVELLEEWAYNRGSWVDTRAFIDALVKRGGT